MPWECPTCHHRENADTDNICYVCKTPRPKFKARKAPTKIKKPLSLPKGSWKCNNPNCRKVNTPQPGIPQNYCAYCRAPRLPPVPPVRRGRGIVSNITEKFTEVVLPLIIFAALGGVAFIFGFFLAGIALILFGFMFPFKRNSPKGALKVAGIIFLASEFLWLHPQFLVALAILWIGYFSLPISYKIGSAFEDYDEAQAQGKFIIGIFLAFALFSAFGGNLFNILGSTQLPILLMGLAFFAITPHRIDQNNQSVGIYIGPKRIAPYQIGEAPLGNIMFLILMAISLVSIVNTWGIQGDFTLTFLLVIFWLASVFVGWVGGPEGRPVAGIIMMGFAFFLFSFQFTGIIGSQVFGPYWAQVSQLSSSVAQPLGEAAYSAGQGLEDAWLLVTCPSCYYEQQQKKSQVQVGRIKTGGTVRSIELVNFQAINYATGTPTIDPTIPLIGSIELENQGEFTADRVEVNLLIPNTTDPKLVSLRQPEKGRLILGNDVCVFESCTGADTISDTKCEWNDPSFPGDIKLMTFKCPSSGQWSSTYPGINTCACNDNKGDFVGACEYCFDETQETQVCGGVHVPVDTVTCAIDCTVCVATHPGDFETECELVCPSECLELTPSTTCDTDQFVVYTKADWMLDIAFDYNFEYNVNVSTPVSVMDIEVFQQKLVNKEITLDEEESKYTGGPVQLSIWIQKQPLRDDETSFSRVSILNKGSGTLVAGAPLTIRIPSTSLVELKEISNINLQNCPDDFMKDLTQDGSAYEITCELKTDLERNDIATITMSFKYDIPDGVNEKSSLFVGNLDYEYRTVKKLQMPIAKAPLVQ